MRVSLTEVGVFSINIEMFTTTIYRLNICTGDANTSDRSRPRMHHHGSAPSGRRVNAHYILLRHGYWALRLSSSSSTNETYDFFEGNPYRSSELEMLWTSMTTNVRTNVSDCCFSPVKSSQTSESFLNGTRSPCQSEVIERKASMIRLPRRTNTYASTWFHQLRMDISFAHR